MRKILSITLALVLALSLCACGGSKKNENETKETSTTPTSDVVDNTDDSVDTDNAADSDDTDVKEPETKEPETTAPVHEHKYASKPTTNPTCTAKGVRTFTCECGDTYTEEIPATGHTFVNYKYDNNATVDKDGTKTSKCSNCNVTDTKVAENTKLSFTYKDMNATMWTTADLTIRELPNTNGAKVGSIGKGASVVITGQCNETKWYRITYNGNDAYISNKYVTTTKPADPLPEKYKGIEQWGPYKVVNGIAFNLDTEEEWGKYAARNNAFWTKLCEAGYDKPVYWDEVGAFYMLVYFGGEWGSSEEDIFIGEKTEWLYEYVENAGYKRTGWTAGCFNSYGDYYIRVDAEKE